MGALEGSQLSRSLCSALQQGTEAQCDGVPGGVLRNPTSFSYLWLQLCSGPGRGTLTLVIAQSGYHGSCDASMARIDVQPYTHSPASSSASWTSLLAVLFTSPPPNLHLSQSSSTPVSLSFHFRNLFPQASPLSRPLPHLYLYSSSLL